MSMRIAIVSYLAPNMFEFYEAVAASLNRALGLETELVQSQYDPLEDPALLADRIDIALICGLPFARHYQVAGHQLQALVAPVMQASRYQNCPVYFSDIIVRSSSNIQGFEDLHLKVLCYNEPGSNSGYNLLRQKLIESGYPRRFFSRVIQSGSHQHSIRWVADGLADCAAIDSTVLEQELRTYPELLSRLRVIESIGPCPMPPVVVARRLGSALIARVKSALLQPDAELQLAMERSHIRGYVSVRSEDYTPLHRLYEAAVQAGYAVIG